MSSRLLMIALIGDRVKPSGYRIAKLDILDDGAIKVNTVDLRADVVKAYIQQNINTAKSIDNLRIRDDGQLVSCGG